ncbi:MAG: hypothetical protein JST68_15620 [Bacteroidetes bacterium]|nr:hypothetical protein [Bacteroidota bacterium]
MQDEVSKHTRKLYKAVKNPNHTLGEKIKEVLIEIFIIVFAVTLSIWLHSWSEHRHEQKEAREFLAGLKSDLTKDIAMLQQNKSSISLIDSNFQYLMQQVKSPVADTSISHRLVFDLRVTRPNIGRYEGFKSSGKMETIENDSLKQTILIFYNQTIPDLVYGENYVNTIQTKILDLEVDKNEKMSAGDFAKTSQVQSLLYLGHHNFGVNIDNYDKAIKEAHSIIELIDTDK